jgi:hypothetical protein
MRYFFNVDMGRKKMQKVTKKFAKSKFPLEIKLLAFGLGAIGALWLYKHTEGGAPIEILRPVITTPATRSIITSPEETTYARAVAALRENGIKIDQRHSIDRGTPYYTVFLPDVHEPGFQEEQIMRIQKVLEALPTINQGLLEGFTGTINSSLVAAQKYATEKRFTNGIALAELLSSSGKHIKKIKDSASSLQTRFIAVDLETTFVTAASHIALLQMSPEERLYALAPGAAYFGLHGIIPLVGLEQPGGMPELNLEMDVAMNYIKLKELAKGLRPYEIHKPLVEGMDRLMGLYKLLCQPCTEMSPDQTDQVAKKMLTGMLEGSTGPGRSIDWAKTIMGLPPENRLAIGGVLHLGSFVNAYTGSIITLDTGTDKYTGQIEAAKRALRMGE